MARFYSSFRLFILIIFTGSPILTGAVNFSRTFRLVNSCPFPIWPGFVSNSGSLDTSAANLTLQPGESKTIRASSPWIGTVWARTNCTQDSSGNFSCITGDCVGECDGSSFGNPPVTEAEFYLPLTNNIDSYGVSLVDGFNLPLVVVPYNSTGKWAVNCSAVGCPRDLNQACPFELQKRDQRGDVVGCRSACEVFGEDRYCCKGAYNDFRTCKPYNYSLIFKNACPRTLTFLFDNQTTLCSGSAFMINFCGPANTSQVPSYLPVNATSTMKPGNVLIYPSQLVSGDGNFTLGFFTLNNTDFSYLGIWHTTDEQRRKVWVANSDSPITMIDSDVKLIMEDSGTLKILQGQRLIMDVTEQLRTANGNTTMAVLQDSGNFVLVDSGAGNQILWQSFDHPTSMLLPGMKLGFNLTTRLNWTLTSWLSLYVAALLSQPTQFL